MRSIISRKIEAPREVRRSRLARRLIVALALVAALAPRVSYAHAALLRSNPRAGSVVGSELTRIRLEFSEELVPDLCHIGIRGPDGSHVDLSVSGDPRDVRALIAPVPSLQPGNYEVMWHAVSADGHPVEGHYRFSVAAASRAAVTTSPAVTIPADSAPAMVEGDSSNRFPTLAALTKGIGLSAVLALAGSLIFSMGHGGARIREYRRWQLALAAIASVALVLHLVLWTQYVMAPAGFTGESLSSMFAHGPARMEMLRVASVIACLLVLLLTSSPAFVLIPAAIAVAVTAQIGHPGSQHPMLSVPLTFLHLVAVSIWTGGLVSLLVVRNVEPPLFRKHASFVSNLAFISVIVVSLTGAAESLVLLTSPGDLIHTAYGRWILAKLAGLFILVIFGWQHRFRALPALTDHEAHEMTLSLRMETAVIAATIIAAAFLSYTPTPR